MPQSREHRSSNVGVLRRSQNPARCCCFIPRPPVGKTAQAVNDPYAAGATAVAEPFLINDSNAMDVDANPDESAPNSVAPRALDKLRGRTYESYFMVFPINARPV
ncbi:hypothetical protein HO173_009177 [Letharia columbiana]|uniref:Uncharacterized protein n=1 Tax=Letharia columbiana TaxID=112416 RepID=A0A8H6FPZ3_9LECA|nr:uncharacterized protein HO173_009177 [Letharia columbiana]KAF6232511.1 hypothetical protein HO173_009177 [Letharia columbiana]